jgi:FkbM family methyltransferase
VNPPEHEPGENVCSSAQGDRRVQVAVHGHGYSLVVPAHDHIGSALTDGRPYEDDLLVALSSLVRPGDVIIDVGANLGNHALYFAVVREAVVHAYEPNPQAMAYLRQNVTLNKVEERVHLYEAALSDKTGFAVIQNPQQHELGLGTAQVIPAAHGPIRTIRLEDVDHGRVRLIKIDVEGSEAAVLRGARSMLAKHMPIIVAEAMTPTARGTVTDVARSLGYHRFPIAFASTPVHVYLARRRDFLRLLLARPVLSRLLVPRWLKRMPERTHERIERAKVFGLRSARKLGLR